MKRAIVAAMLAFYAGPALADAVKNPLQPSETWDELRYDVAGDADLLDGSARLSIDAPYRAHDAATVPITIREIDGGGADFVRLILIVDENPAPVVAEFELGPAMGEIDLEARVRVDRYSNVRVLAEGKDGKTYMVGRFVKASGGCSAPALKDMEASIASIGKMKFRLFDGADTAKALPASGARREAQVMMRHPNYSGMQMNQVTQLFIPAHFMDMMEVRQGEDLVFRLSGGISISENPSFRFKYVENGAGEMHVTATDTDGETFERRFATAGS